MIRLLKFLKPYAATVAAVLVLTLLNSLSDLYLPTILSDIIDNGIVKGDIPYILRMGSIMLLVSAIGVACMVGASYLSSKASSGFGRDLRKKVFSHVENFSLAEFDKFGTASLITRTTNDITQMQQVVLIALRMMLMAPMLCIGGIIMAVTREPQLSIILVFVIPVIAAIVIVASRYAIPLFNVMQKKLDKLNLILRENLTGIRVIRAFNRIDHEKKRFNDTNLDLANTAIRANKVIVLLIPFMTLIMGMTTVSIIWYSSNLIDAGLMQVGNMMAFIQYAMQIMLSLIMLSMMFVMLPRASASAVRINEVLDTVAIIMDPEIPKDTGSMKGYIEFKNVTFSYPNAEQPAISNISFSARPGETTAIIGGTGSGKSTILNLIPRFYDVNSGSILIDGVDIREMTQENLRSKIGFVPQKAMLFSGSIDQNIRYGKEDASNDDIIQAAKTAQAMEFISAMKDGFDSYISQGGTNVSGGQKQRLSIARALVKKPEIYVFDDSFSALDFKTDARLRSALKEETKDSTVIIVAQRVSTVMDADKIVVLDEGRIAGIGSHKELLNTCEVYREIVLSQLSEEELA